MKICLINNLYNPYERGGADKITKIIADGLKARDHQVVVISLKPKKSQIIDSPRSNYYLQSNYFDLAQKSFVFKLLWHFFDIFNIVKAWRIRKILIKERVEVAITNNLMGIGFLIPRLIKILKIRHFHILHDIQLLHPSGLMYYNKEKKIKSLGAKMYQLINRFLFSQVDIVIGPSQWIIDIHLDNNFFPRTKVVKIPNPIDFSAIHKEEKKEYDFIYIGELEKQKGIEILIKAILDLSNSQKINIAIIGQGSYLDMMRKKFENYEEVKILGWQKNAEAMQNLRKSRCLILPSICYENSPTVIYEAAACGVAFIASNIGGISELGEELGGYLFESGSSKNLQKIMLWALKNPELLKKAGEDSYKKMNIFSQEIYLKNLEKFLFLS